MKHSVVMPLYLGRPELIDMTKRSIKRMRETSTMEFEFVILETGSSHFKGECDRFIHEPIRHPSRGTHSMNILFQEVKSDFITFLSNDVFVNRGWLEAMERCFKEFDDCGIASCGSSELGQKEEPLIIEMNYCPIAMFSRKCIEDVGKFDENIVGVWNDTDFIMRMYEKGWRHYQNLSVIVDHLVSQTDGKEKDYSEVYEKNRNYFIEKHQHTPLRWKFRELVTGEIDFGLIRGKRI